MKKLASIHIYPIKSLGGIDLETAKIERRGLRFDRRWMLVDAENKFLTQREIPEMALFRTQIDGDFLTIFHQNRPAEKLKIRLEPDVSDFEKIATGVWDWSGQLFVGEREADAFFSDFLNKKVRLAYQSESIHRQTDENFAERGQIVSLADAFPFLFIGQSSLDFLNQKMPKNIGPFPMNRFRPNLVFTGGDAFEEDVFRKIKVGDAIFECLKPCARCVMTTIDQKTAARAAEPLRTLATFRQVGHKILFGQNAVWLGDEKAGNEVRVGDLLEPF